MPSLGADMDSGKVAEWLVSPGDVVHKGDIIAVIDTAKAAIDVEVFSDGTVAELLVEPGVEVPVGTVLARIEETSPGQAAGPQGEPPVAEEPRTDGKPPVGGVSSEGELPTGPAPLAEGEPSGGAVAPAVVPTQEEPPPAERGREGTERVAAPTAPSPPVRHLAHQLGVDLGGVTGTGPGGRVTRDDILAVAREHPGPPITERVPATPLARRLADERGVDLAALIGSGAHGRILAADVPASPSPGEQPAERERTEAHLPDQDKKQAMRAAIASLMSRSAAEIPHYYVSTTVDLATALEWLAEHNRGLPAAQRVLPVALFLRATVLAAQQVPQVNGHWVDGELHPADGVSPGVAVSTRDGGLVTPRIEDAHELALDPLMAALGDLVRRARRGRLRAAELQPGTITLSSLADGGPDALFGVIYPPQVALVGVGAVAERPWAIDGMLTVRPTVTISVAADHRATDGRTGAAFLAALTQSLSHPEEL